jgi:thioredoxin
MKSKIFSLFLLNFLILSCQGQSTKEVKTVDVKTFAEKLSATSNPQLLDVRTPEEFSDGHIDNAVNVDWNGNYFVAQAKRYDQSKPIFVYCKVGGRSSQAAAKLAELGFKEIYNLDGGYMKWDKSGITDKNEKIIGMCDQEFNELLLSNDRVMVDFNAKWCAPCIKMKPYITKLQTELKDQIKIVLLDADENKTLVKQMKLDSLPVIIIYEKGKEVWRNLGYISEEELRKHL